MLSADFNTLSGSWSQAIGAIAQLHAQLLEDRREVTGGLLEGTVLRSCTACWHWVPFIRFSSLYLVVVVAAVSFQHPQPSSPV